MLRSLASRLVWPLRKRYLPPGLHHLASSAAAVSSSFEDLISEIVADQIYRGEFDERLAELEAELDNRLRSNELTFPESFSLGSETSKLLYTLVRCFRPEIAVETGVANGISTFFILQAMNANGTGELHSFDIRSNVGSVLVDHERARWVFHHLQADPLSELERALDSLSPIDLFMHDSFHDFRQQDWEYRKALPNMAKDGIVASDDVDKSFAFTEFCSSREASPFLLVDTIRVFGVVPVQELSR